MVEIEERMEKKVEKFYKRFIGPNSIGMSGNLEAAIKKALGIALTQQSKRQERRLLEECRRGIVSMCNKYEAQIPVTPTGIDRDSYRIGWRDAHINIRSVADLPDYFQSEVWGKESIVDALES